MRLFESACDMGLGAGCNNLAVMYSKGYGVRIDEQQAIVFFEKACNLKYSLGCKNYIKMTKQ